MKNLITIFVLSLSLVACKDRNHFPDTTRYCGGDNIECRLQLLLARFPSELLNGRREFPLSLINDGSKQNEVAWKLNEYKELNAELGAKNLLTSPRPLRKLSSKEMKIENTITVNSYFIFYSRSNTRRFTTEQVDVIFAWENNGEFIRSRLPLEKIKIRPFGKEVKPAILFNFVDLPSNCKWWTNCAPYRYRPCLESSEKLELCVRKLSDATLFISEKEWPTSIAAPQFTN